jgi:GTP-binding protein
VGKSSLLNALSGRTLARVSATPGLTRALCFYAVSDWLRLVDMPGYGFAFASDAARTNWQELVRGAKGPRAPRKPRRLTRQGGLQITTYVRERTTLRRLLVLVDGRHGLKVNDRTFLDQLDRYARHATMPAAPR